MSLLTPRTALKAFPRELDMHTHPFLFGAPTWKFPENFPIAEEPPTLESNSLNLGNLPTYEPESLSSSERSHFIPGKTQTLHSMATGHSSVDNACVHKNSKNHIVIALEETGNEVRSHVSHTPRPSSLSSSIIFISDDEDEGREPQENLGQMSRSALATMKNQMDAVLIDIDEIELESRSMQEPDFQFLRSASISKTRTSNTSRPKPKTFPQRNPPIINPYVTCERFSHGRLNIRPGKTVELHDGDFIYIKYIVEDSRDHSVTFRGLRLLRTKFLNGMLEKKLNEVCLCYHIDLDDPRDPEEQSVVEVPLSSINTLRSLRWTNDTYPRCRNIDADSVATGDVANTGGLTVRWKYICTYATASDRDQNHYMERSFERINTDLLSRLFLTSHRYLTSDAALRSEWRGETISGGSFRSRENGRDNTNITEPQTCMSPFMSGTKRNITYVAIDDDCDVPNTEFTSLKPNQNKTPPVASVEARGNTNPAKRLCFANKSVEETRKHLSRITLSHKHENVRRCPPYPLHIDVLRNTTLKIRYQSDVPLLDRHHRSVVPSPAISPQINVASSEVSTPPPTGVVDLSLASAPHQNRHTSIASRRSLPASKILARGQAYTYGDAFCGGGGTTRGASMAGLHVKWGFDFNPHACETWRLNFPNAACYPISSQDFVALATSTNPSQPPIDVKVDILHISPPCQYFSPAHTIDGKDDEMNVASLFAVFEVIGVARPRVVTLEQTFGILHGRFRPYFAGLVHMFTSRGFSLRWAIKELAQWGLPQRRFRLIIIASCPGEPLPPMPPATHSSPRDPLPNTRPYNTVRSTLLSIPWNARNHSPHLQPRKDLPRWNANTILPRTMTTSGGENYHPNGKRNFTIREYASLQGFPLQHRFAEKGVKRQIGNAVPPVIAEVLFKGIRKWMEKVDGVVRADGDDNDGGGESMGDMERLEDGGDEVEEVGSKAWEDVRRIQSKPEVISLVEEDATLNLRAGNNETDEEVTFIGTKSLSRRCN